MMRSSGLARRRNSRLVRATLLTWVVLAATAASAAAQMNGDLRYVRGYDLITNPPTTHHPTTLILYGVYPTDCGAVEEASVIDSANVKIRLRSQAQCDSAIASWSASFALGMLTMGNHTVTIALTMDRPDSEVMVYQGSLTFGVEDSTVNPPPPPPVYPLVFTTTTDPWPPTPTVPMALIVGGYTPFNCPVWSVASVIDTSHLAITLSPGPACGDTVGFWTQRFELGLQREGHHLMDLAITLEGDSTVTHHIPVGFLVVNDTTGWGPPPTDSLDKVLSPSRPNPFVNESRFSISLEVGGNAHVSVFDINGRRVSTVFRGRLEPGTTELAWNGRRDDGSRAAAGVYFYRLEMQGRVMARRLVLLRQ